MMRLDEQQTAFLRDLAEGSLDPGDWLAWWDANAAAIEAVTSPGLFLAIKPRGVESNGANAAALGSQKGACKALDQLNISYERSNRYQLGWQQDFQQFLKAKELKTAARLAEYEPRIAELKSQFPRFAKFLMANVTRIVEMGAPAREDELAHIEAELGRSLPVAYAKFLRCARTLVVDDVLQFTSTHPFIHHSTGSGLSTERMLCIADFWLDADGDQAMIDVGADVTEDPPVLYYAHEAPGLKLRTIATHFTEWVEALPRDLKQ
ncbi:MAG: hypothetical protein JNK76_11040 [Planctomycetales bacterium]|nr:hypothetical protein [Planctomycetales bacterium]MBN8627899.1 hypothetical protein [Planctomycetota bacterium]